MRTCGECTACCVALAVQELDKPRYRPCLNLDDRGCGNYVHRPGSCRDYQCLWLQGFLDENDRPDKLGVIFTVTSDPTRPEEGNLPMLVECVKGTLDQPRVRTAIVQFIRQKPLVIMTEAGTRVLQPVQVTIEGRRPIDNAA